MNSRNQYRTVRLNSPVSVYPLCSPRSRRAEGEEKTETNRGTSKTSQRDYTWPITLKKVFSAFGIDLPTVVPTISVIIVLHYSTFGVLPFPKTNKIRDDVGVLDLVVVLVIFQQFLQIVLTNEESSSSTLGDLGSKQLLRG